MKKILSVLLVMILGVTVLTGCNKKDKTPVVNDEADVQEQADAAIDGEPTTNVAKIDEDEILHRYKVESATIAYQYSGMQSGTETLVFDQWGLREYKESSLNVNVWGYDTDTNTVTMFLHWTIITYNKDDRTGTKLEQPDFLEQLKAEAIANNKSLADLSVDMLTEMWGVQEWTKELLGKTCDIWKIDQLGTTACLWKGILLESVIDFMGQSQIVVATSYDDGADESVFDIPEDITFVEGDAAQEMANGFLEEEVE